MRARHREQRRTLFEVETMANEARATIAATVAAAVTSAVTAARPSTAPHHLENNWMCKNDFQGATLTNSFNGGLFSGYFYKNKT